MSIRADELKKCAERIKAGEVCNLTYSGALSIASELERLEAALADKEKKCQRLREVGRYLLHMRLPLGDTVANLMEDKEPERFKWAYDALVNKEATQP